MRRTTEERRQAQAKREVNAALWALACQATQRPVAMLPRSLRPMPLSAAVPRAVAPIDHHAKVRAQLCTQLLFDGAGDQSQRRSAVDRAFIVHCNEPGTVAAQAASVDFDRQLDDAFAAVAQPLHLETATVRALPEQISRTLAGDGRPPCTAQSSQSGFNAATLQTRLDARVQVYRPLEALADLLDPQGWDRCSDLFEDTHRVELRNGKFVAVEPCHGSDWSGLLYERAAVGPQAVENILDVNYRRTADAVYVTYDLYRSLSYTLGGMQLSGVMRQNCGFVEAIRREDNPDITDMRVVKTIRYDRLSTWSGSDIIDAGEIANYLAPGFLTLWFYDLTRIVPCCEAPRPDPSPRG